MPLWANRLPVPAVACHCQFRCCSLVYPLFSTLCHLLRCFLRVCLYCILAGRGAERLGILARAAGPFALVHQREPFQASHRGLVWEVLHRDLKCSNLLLDVSGRATELQQDIARRDCPRTRCRCIRTLWSQVKISDFGCARFAPSV